jgi:DNA-binding MarR family transcriptional regulator
MKHNELVNQAQHIFTTSAFIRDHFFKAHAEGAKKLFKNKEFQELTLAQHMAVMTIDQYGPITIKNLASILNVSPPSASAMVDKLVEKKILIREQSRMDRREVLVRISPETAKRVEKMKQVTLKSIIDVVQKVGPETARKWCGVMDEIKRVIEN